MASKSKPGVMSLEELRQSISSTQAALASLATAPLPLGEALTALTVGVDSMAAAYRERIVPLLTQVPRGQPLPELLSVLLPSMESDPRLVRAFLLVALHEPLLALWRTTLQEIYEQDAGLVAAAIPRSERPARRAALQETLRSLGLQEELVIVEAESRGLAVDRRPDCDPSVLFDPAVLEPATPAA